MKAKLNDNAMPESERKPDCCDQIFQMQCCLASEKVSDRIIKSLEKVFYRLGFEVASRPGLTTVLVLIVVIIFVPGIFTHFEEESEEINLWTPLGISARHDRAEAKKYFPNNVRLESLLIEDENVLSKQSIQGMFNLDNKVKSLAVDGAAWETICYRSGDQCWYSSILELFPGYDESTANSLTMQDILRAVNTQDISPVFNTPIVIESYLGGITRDGDGSIVGAKAASMKYFVSVTEERIPDDDPINAWEDEFLGIGREGEPLVDTVYYFAGRSFGDVAGETIGGDARFLGVGYTILIIYIAVCLGRFNLRELRAYLALVGVVCVGLGIALSIGFSSYLGYAYGPLHSVLPFLILGIGVDDMFVVVTAWEELEPHLLGSPIPDRMAVAMQHAGISILVTSVTDILAFGIGATTILPALRSFCVYCCIGVAAIFLFTTTLFVAALALDERRKESSRNACCCCVTLETNYAPNTCSQKTFLATFFSKYYAPVLIQTKFKTAVVLATLTVFFTSCYYVTKLKQEFDDLLFVPSSYYLHDYIVKSREYFPDSGLEVYVYIVNLADQPFNYFEEQGRLAALNQAIIDNKYTLRGSVDSWFMDYNSYLADRPDYGRTGAEFYQLLPDYLSTNGSRFQGNIVFHEEQTDLIKASRMRLVQGVLIETAEQISAMDSVRKVCSEAGITSDLADCFVYADAFLGYESNRVIRTELYRNLALSFLCIFLVTLLLLANIWSCFLVSLCVIMSLVDVGGFMHAWDLTINTVTTIFLIIAIGLTVDYSAHIAHTFMTKVGSRNGRIRATVMDIGTAVFHGAFSTFLAFCLLIASESYVFTAFFRVFFLVVLFGLFHGLCFLPVLLSLVGPPPYISAREAVQEGQRRTARSESNSLHESVQVQHRHSHDFDSLS